MSKEEKTKDENLEAIQRAFPHIKKAIIEWRETRVSKELFMHAVELTWSEIETRTRPSQLGKFSKESL
jgi:hypothetical protein